nr:hypothetical protein [Tanacetum cinerariifolium]
MEIDIEEDENEPKLTYPYEEVDPLNPLPLVTGSKPDDKIEDSDSLLPGLMRRDINSLFGRMTSILRRLCGCETAHVLVKNKGKAKEKFYGKLILDLGNEVRLVWSKERLQWKSWLKSLNERVERDLYWTRVRAHEFYQEMIRRGFVFQERPNKAINVPIEDEKSHVFELQESPYDP